MSILPKTHGIFYPNSSKALLQLFHSYDNVGNYTNSKLIIIPHAGYEFSGELAFKTYKHLDKNINHITIIAPAIHNKIFGTVTADKNSVKTPIGSVKILPYKTDINNKILENESALCVQLPIIKYLFSDKSVRPIIYGCEDYNNITKIIDNEYKQNNGIVIATNLSRFIPAREALKLDNHLCKMIEKKQIEDLDTELADGAIGICAAISFARKNNFNLISTGHSMSSDINNDTSSVVGYGGWYMSTQ